MAYLSLLTFNVVGSPRIWLITGYAAVNTITTTSTVLFGGSLSQERGLAEDWRAGQGLTGEKRRNFAWFFHWGQMTGVNLHYLAAKTPHSGAR